MFQQQFGGFGGQAQLAALQKKEKADRERAEFEAKLDTVSETYSERLSGLSEALPASIVTAGKMTVGLTVSSVFGLKHYGGKMLWFGICVGMFGMIPNILLGEQAAEKYRVEEARKAKVFGGGIGGMPGGANMGQQVARR